MSLTTRTPQNPAKKAGFSVLNGSSHSRRIVASWVLNSVGLAAFGESEFWRDAQIFFENGQLAVARDVRTM